MTATGSAPASAVDAIRALFAASGGEWTDVPVIQPLGLLLDLGGEGLRAHLVTVASSAEECVLRPDFTIPLTRQHIAAGGGTARYLYGGDAFRAAPDGRPEAFPQIGVEALGSAHDPVADDAAVAGLAWRACAVGGRPDLQLRLGDMALFRSVLTAMALPAAMVERLVTALPNPRLLARVLDRAQDAASDRAGASRLASILVDLPEPEAAALLEELWGLAGIRPVGGRSAAEIVHRLSVRADADRTPPLSAAEAALIREYLGVSGEVRAALEAIDRLAAHAGADLTPVMAEWTRRNALLIEAGAAASRTIFSAGFARPFSYYDGLLFEVVAPGVPAPLSAGGRYDGLPARLGGEPGAVGCMVRPDLVWSGR